MIYACDDIFPLNASREKLYSLRYISLNNKLEGQKLRFYILLFNKHQYTSIANLYIL